MSPVEPASDEVVTSDERPAVTAPGPQPSPPPAEADTSAGSASSNGSQQNGADSRVRSQPDTEAWTLEARSVTDDLITVKLRHAPNDKTNWARFRENVKDLGPPITGIASVAIAALVFYYGYQINKRQAVTQEAQAATQKSQAETARSDLQLKILSEFSKSLADLSATDEKTKTLAAIRFVQYKADALAAIQPALGVKEPAIRSGATTVIVHLLESGSVSRDDLMSSLLEYFKAGNAYTRTAIFETFIGLDRRLSPAESTRITQFLVTNLKTETTCSTPEEAEVLQQAALFLGLWPSSNSADLLLKIGSNPTCARPAIQALDNVVKVGENLDPQQRQLIVDKLEAMAPNAPDDRKPQIAAALDSLRKMNNR